MASPPGRRFYVRPVQSAGGSTSVTRRIDTAAQRSLARYRDRYSEGDCWVLALALAGQSGWQIGITDGQDHAFVLAPDGEQALDILGLRPLEDLLDEWGAEQAQLFESAADARSYFFDSDWGSFSERIQWRQADRIASQLLACYVGDIEAVAA